ncbi:hypothetical protein [Ornithinimicrobium sp. INDO-MA30-4]|uniref:hypothetical protein n=1 Tax=Ornithinimicrobium sp. INDO-MA30-4 TaxID=2908651 RepID=UPI001F2CAEAB|nr:hypothetical protein [Ornithinimicrobium sp. INDO-MA30-4]UJH70546.1 hypothetical protein L0A91_16075 [Ornithinimicrobium sp. INDO-MA30-4]
MLFLMGITILILGLGLLLQARGPGNMGTGFLQGAGVGLLASLVVLWRITRHPERATTFERAFSQTGDEREDALLTHAFATLGLVAIPLTGVAAVAMGLGAEVPMVLFFLLVAQVMVFAVAFVVNARRG